MAGKLTQKATLKELAREAAAGADRMVYDDAIPGFAARLRRGNVAFVLEYRKAGRVRRFSLGRLGAVAPKKVRELAAVAHAAVLAGGDPAAERRAERERKATVGDALDRYLADLAQRAEVGARRGRRSTVAEFRRIAEKAIRAKLGGVEVERLDAARVKAWHRALAATPAQANRALTVLAAALRPELPAGADPFAGVVKFREEPKQERYALAELERVGAALRAAEAAGGVLPSAALALRLLLLAGLRRAEVLGHMMLARRSEGDALRWGDVDLDAGALRLRRAKAGSRVVVLGRPARELLAAARPADADPGAPVCPGASPGAPLVGFEKAVAPIFAAAGVEWKGSHACRRTFASVAGERGLGEYVVAALLGHGGGSVTARYVIPGADPLRVAADGVAGEIAAALDGRRAPVVPFDREARK